MSAHYVNKDHPALGYYEVFTAAEGSRWHWIEVANGVRYEEHGAWRPNVAAAYRDAADDWESNGNSSNKRLGGQLRAAATRAEKEQWTSRLGTKQ